MKNFFLLFTALLVCLNAKSQNKGTVDTKPAYIIMDSLLRYVEKQKIDTGILYDRVIANANLIEFNNERNNKSTDFWHFVQSFSEINRAKLINAKKLNTSLVDKLIDRKDNIVEIGIINTDINYIDYGTKENPNLTFRGGYFYNIPNKNPIRKKQVTVIAALVEEVHFKNIRIVLSRDFVADNSSNPILELKTIINGKVIFLINNFEKVTQESIVELQGNEKEILFNIKYSDGRTTFIRSTINISLPVRASPTDCLLEEDFIDNFGIGEATLNNIPFKGYNEIVARKGKLEYRTYYNTITNNCNLPLKIVKPIIILDGYDPGDKRKIYTGSVNYSEQSKSLFGLMIFDPDNNAMTANDKNFINDILRPQGFDVTLVNFPDGADYVERNAMALVSLLQRENAKLIDNGSNEKITLIGPSMSGLISRYALAYMEKNNISHNVKLWVSFDSPHLGANIPISAQENIYFFGYAGEKEKARKQFHENFASPFTRQILIEQMDNKHLDYNWNTDPLLSPMPDGAGQNSNSPFRQQFLSNLEINNGLPNSKGFPLNVRKIALINGTTNGTKNGNEGGKSLELAGFKPSWFKVISFDNRNLGNPSSNTQIFSGQVPFPRVLAQIFGTQIPWAPSFTCRTRNRINFNPRGSMDIVQGGTIDISNTIRKNFQIELNEQEVDAQWRAYQRDNTFIPTISSLAFKNDSFNWALAQNRNLVCNANNKEIIFDSYFSPSKNEEHVALTNESVEWLLKEINGNPQAPWFNIDKDNLIGLTNLCVNQTSNYAFHNDVCKLPSAVISWELTPNLELLNSDSFSISVKSISSGESSITAIFTNGMKVTKTIWIGVPQFNTLNFTERPNQSLCLASIDPLILSLPSLSVTAVFDGQTNTEIQTNINWEWIRSNNLIQLNGTRNNRQICPMYLGTSSINVRAKNACGWSDWTEIGPFEITEGASNANRNTQTSNYVIFPNPTTDVINIDLKDKTVQQNASLNVSAQFFDFMGQQKQNIQIINDKATLNVQGYKKGIYLLKINTHNGFENHYISIN